ncbi:hypothetical protein LSUE1_G000458 [Lachnellula suecica]|uniref:SMODS and SLOG-associating 2TM effector domain-containing protein n=1 Tax=Lachnellula suecica TaxID=602035 RepID=A0A8T9CFW7_9HELO|nr:hypothetical protein LSUE1_G000458 [Lachnellula suecica]
MNRLKDILSIAFGRKGSGETDAEFGRSQDTSTAIERQSDQAHVHLATADVANEELNVFRLLTGITSHMSHNHAARTPTGFRPAANLGIYARVVHNEKTAKSGYKRFSVLINGCLGLQIVVAASLTALGAAGKSHGAVTVFGAINTVIAGILTFLKGSGLPSRLKYYQNEWKKVREFIEQRERDFSRPGCTLDPYRVVATIETMYEEVKLDTEANTPDRYAGVGNPRTMATMRPDAATDYPRHAIVTAKDLREGFGNKAHDLESNLRSKIHDTAKDLEAGISEKLHHHHTGSDLSGKESEIHHSGFDHKVKELELFGDKLKDLASDIGQKAKDATQDFEAQRINVVRDAGQAEEQARRIASQGHDVIHGHEVIHGHSNSPDSERKDSKPSGS